MLNLRVPRTIAANSRLAIRNALALGVPEPRLFLFPNVVDCDEFRVASKPSHDPIRLVTAGRLVEQKRHDRFIRLLARLRERLPVPVQGIIAGDGPAYGALKQQAHELQLTAAHLEFRGLSQTMRDLYSVADAFVLASDWEGTPNVVLEAMASGVPVVSTDVGGVADLIEHGVSGFLVDPNAEDDLVARVAQLIEHPSLRTTFAEMGRRRIEADFSVRNLLPQLESLYQAVAPVS
jgi:glycosyltransferase involved in cell wall biosynthesis